MPNFSDKTLHIVAFDVPWPANYGGVIDVFHKIRHLKNSGVKVILHCFIYGERGIATALNDFCEEVHYYPRNTSILKQFSLIPFIINSRVSDKLLDRLSQDNHPILFEGLHSCFLLDHPQLKERFKIYRESNIEHRYYFHLAKATRHPGQKIFFIIESLRLKLFQRILKNASLMLVVSEADTQYLRTNFPKNDVHYLPSFHANDEISSKPGKGVYFLYHGKLSVAENAVAAEYLIHKIFAGLHQKLIIAGMNPSEKLQKSCAMFENIELIANPSEPEMDRLQRDAQAHVLLTFQATGLKLKLLNSLYKGRFCITNKAMLHGTGLNELCIITDGDTELKSIIQKTADLTFDELQIKNRTLKLSGLYNNQHNTDSMLELIFQDV
ncbi:MAG: glycosyltransferase family 1 protein [Bacteroidales bacterium]|jgi:hypothetical protein|nr:glycosyltransferase family 1 protein [Bacteroidales bacterium]